MLYKVFVTHMKDEKSLGWFAAVYRPPPLQS